MKGFYPTHLRDGLEKLRFYARRFPCVEADTFTYAIPQPANVQKWAECTPPGFLFHPKLFGAFCGQDVEVGQLPCSVRALPSMGGWRDRLKERAARLRRRRRLRRRARSRLRPRPSCFPLLTPHRSLLKERVSLARLPEEALEALWGCYHEALAPLQAAGRLGVVMMQEPRPRPSPRPRPRPSPRPSSGAGLLPATRPSSRRARPAVPPSSARAHGSARSCTSLSSCAIAAGWRRSASHRPG